MPFGEIAKIVAEKNAKMVVLICHHNADPDAICSAFALQGLLKQLYPYLKAEIGASHGISRLSKHILNFLPVKIRELPDIKSAEIIILLDTNTIRQLGELGERVKTAIAPVVVVDHHASHPDTEALAALCLNNEEASSTCEIVYGFYKDAGIRPGQDEAKALFLGIAFDTRHFVLAKSSTLKNVAELVELGVAAQETLPLLSLPMDFSERIARLKASRRVKLFKIDRWIVALSHVSAYQASAARALIDLGADVAAVTGQKNGTIEVSLRSTLEFNRTSGIHLGKDIAKPLGELICGMGGGHSTAAGANGSGDTESTLGQCLRILKRKLASQ